MARSKTEYLWEISYLLLLIGVKKIKLGRDYQVRLNEYYRVLFQDVRFGHRTVDSVKQELGWSND